ncbi:hypothetical protein K505DRAFT_321734 [Melanomma pulvis-pyrius CBS 109.77]|uniref:RING-type domain-containing protein n=1 Tax=Melanomma pulvis-pyrius CBS 109.77 TaxID=1314802 RepID=A0A6A6XPV0_9PLEO|nr:hypothetical protein K505DRAFT_321734 [Melanomma pulvis-pyrius CBS 109.77]
MPAPNPLWNPRQVLQISDDGCCVGYAPSKRRKCRIGIAGHNLYKAHTVLDSIAEADPDADAVRTKLHNLAGYMLCVRWHQAQAGDMVNQWVGRMKLAYPHGEVVAQPRARTSPSSRSNTPSSMSASSSASVSSQRSTSSASSVSLTTHSERGISEERYESLLEQMRIFDRRLAESVQQSELISNLTSLAIARISTSNTSALDPSRSSTVSSSSVSTTRPQAQASISPRSSASAGTTRPQARPLVSSSTSSTRPQAQASASSSSAIAAPPQARASTSSANNSTIRSAASATSSDQSADTVIVSSSSRTHSHVRQRPIDDECHICMDDFLPDDLIMWCKSGCGRSVHQNCFQTWQTACVARGRSATGTCVFCRAAWESQSAVKFRESSSSCTRTHVRRLDVDEECPICQEDYKPEDSLVWCKDGCGRVVHRDCFQEWQVHLGNSETSATCAFCRRAWSSDCGCDI